MPQSDATTDGQDDDYLEAHRLYNAAYSLMPDDSGPPSEVVLQLLRAAAYAWDRHLSHGASGATLTLSDSLKEWCDRPSLS